MSHRISKRVETRKVKELKPKSKIEKHKKVALSLLILLIIGAVASYYLSKTTDTSILTTHSSTSIPENKPPEIDVNIKKVGFGRYELYAKVYDENLEDVKLFLNVKELNLLNENGLYKAFIEVYEDSNFTLVAKDRFGLESKFSGNIFVSKNNPNAYYALKKGLNPKHIDLILPLDNDSNQDSNEKVFIDYLINIQRHLKDERLKNEILKFTGDGKITSDETKLLEIISKNDDENVKSILNIYFNSPKTFSEILRNAYNANVKIDRDVLIGEVCKITETLRIRDYVKVLNVKIKGYEIKEINLPTIQVIGNYTLAIKLLNLPAHEKESIWLLTNATMINPEIYDFKPVVLKDVDGWIYLIGSKDIPRDTWMLVEHLKRTPYVVKYPELYLSYTIKVQQNAWDVFENPALKYWKDEKYFEDKYKPTDEIIWEKVIIPQWNYYWESFPQSGNISKRVIVFPVYNSTLLRQIIPNENDLKIALMIFWGFNDLRSQGVADLNANWKELYKGKGIHRGLDAMSYIVQVLPEIYNRVISLYPNKTVPFSRANPEPMDIRFAYYSWIYDRGWHGLRNMFKQFVGFYPVDWGDIINNKKIPLSEFHKYIIQNYDAINTHLFKNFEKYDLIAFVIGYNTHFFGPDFGQDYFWVYAFKAFGIPSLYDSSWSEYYINAPARYAAGFDTCIFGLPENVLKPLREGMYGKVLILPGNGICPIGSAIEGVEKDIEYGNKHPTYPNLKYAEVALSLRGNRIYLFKVGSKG